ncbi:MAG TPA: hypothetical protein VN177_03175 [Myxococcales bacterium]|jgi:hypothetical protein|nr:hypothetical protein [Myxococcales bacterium]
MAKKRMPPIEVGYQAFAQGSEEEFGAVRQVRPQDLVVYIEDAGDTIIPLSAVTDVIEGKVIVDTQKLDEGVRRAIANAHRDEDYP